MSKLIGSTGVSVLTFPVTISIRTQPKLQMSAARP